LEDDPQDYINKLVAVFNAFLPILKPTASVWVNLGDTYWSGRGQHRSGESKQSARRFGLRPQDKRRTGPWTRAKQLMLMPHRFAISMQDSNWIVRNDKRAITFAPSGQVALSMKDEAFQRAITDLTWWPENEQSDLERPFVDVFGSVNAPNEGTKKKKYRSNGPADTLKNGAWSKVVRVAEGERSKVAALQSDYIDSLMDLTVLKDEQRSMPLVQDAAVWYFRKRNVSDIVGETTETQVIEKKLVDAFRSELGLTPKDVQILFG
jgi:hypothetical protein